MSWIPDSKAQDFEFRKQIVQDSGFHKQNFPLFRNPDSLARGDAYVYWLGRDGVVEVIINSSGGPREGAPGGPGPPLFLDQSEALRAENKIFGDRPPPSY